MSTAAAYLCVILIWATTPLAIKWSSAGVSFYDAVLLRMTIALPFALTLTRLFAVRLPWGRAWRSYAAGAFGIFGGLLPVYYASQYIPSGLISVLYGFAPILSSVLAARWLDESSLTLGRLVALLVAICGLALVFHSELAFGAGGEKGLAAVLGSVTAFTICALLIKRENAVLHPLAQTTGTLLFAYPMYLLAWLCKDGSVPATLEARALLATLYLAVFGSIGSFVMYFYILQRLPLSRVALTTLVSPVIAVILGAALAHEQLAPTTLTGGALILCALVMLEWGEKLLRWLESLKIG